MNKNNQKLIRLPIIYNAGGDISKEWFIEFYVRNPRNNAFVRQRKMKGINKFHTVKERNAAAEKMKRYWTDKLRAGWTPFTDQSVIYDDNLEYQTFIKNYRSTKSRNGTFRFFASKYIDSIKNKIEDSTISTYRSKLRLFDAWLENEEINNADISCITQPVLVKFMGFIIEERKLSKVSIDNYRILLSAVFDFVRKERKQYPNPCFELPGTKRINDSSADPIQETDIPIFKKLILKKDPQLWLAICFEYYCFMRPRKEIRLLRIGDIDFGTGMIKVRHENSKTVERRVGIPDPFMKLIRDQYELQTFPRNYYVFSYKGKPGTEKLGINNFSNRFVRFRKQLKMPEMYKMYSWKHTGNIRAKIAGITPQELQPQNGHTTILTTEKYLRKNMAYISPNLIKNFPEV